MVSRLTDADRELASEHADWGGTRVYAEADVEQIVRRHLNAAADEIEADMNHDACRNATLATAARIVRSLAGGAS